MAINVTIEGYDSLEQIGIGGMAAVYKARKVSIDKTVAVKVLFPYLAGDASFTERFQREAKAAASIQHENIVNVIDYGESDGSYFIVMEYYDGETLDDLLQQRNKIPLDVAIQILLEVCFGLESAHAQGIVHRDIKPGNIIYTRQGGIKIADFGLAKRSDSVTMITQHGKVIGTPAYMSPEQAAGRDVGPQSDIFSLGVVAYELLGQRKPFEGQSYSEILEMIQTTEPQAISEINPLIQPAIASVIGGMLVKDESRRYASAADVISDVEKAMERLKISRDRRMLAAYIKDPESYERKFRERTITNCLSQGAYYMQQGNTHLEDAVVEFRKILYLDPNNDRARKNLERIKKERGDKDRTLALDHVVVAPVDSEEKPPPVERARVAPAARLRRRWPFAGAAAVIVFVALLAIRGLGERTVPNEPPRVSAPSTLAVSPGAAVSFALQALDADGDSIRFHAEDLPDGAELSATGEFNWTVAEEQVGTHEVTFIADDGQSKTRVVTAIEVGKRVEPLQFDPIARIELSPGERLSALLHATGGSGRPISYRLLDGPGDMQIKDGRIVWRAPRRKGGMFHAVVEATDGATALQREVVVSVSKPPAPRPQPTRASVVEVPSQTTPVEKKTTRYGTLSVYFLGGVGEFIVDGKPFAHQPPFSGVEMPAGEHRVTCRFNAEEDGRNLTITVEPGKETVIEYEVGGDPVVNIES